MTIDKDNVLCLALYSCVHLIIRQCIKYTHQLCLKADLLPYCPISQWLHSNVCVQRYGMERRMGMERSLTHTPTAKGKLQRDSAIITSDVYDKDNFLYVLSVLNILRLQSSHPPPPLKPASSSALPPLVPVRPSTHPQSATSASCFAIQCPVLFVFLCFY